MEGDVPAVSSGKEKNVFFSKVMQKFVVQF